MKRFFLGCIFSLILLAVAGVVGINQLSRFYWQEPKAEAQEVEFSVAEGESFGRVASNLEAQGLVASKIWFRIGAEIAGMTDAVKAGPYTLQPGLSYQTVLAILTAGTTQADIRVTVPEGYTLKQIGVMLEDKGLATAEDWAKATGQFSSLESHEFVVAAQKPDGVDLEGYLFPDTYRFFPSATAEDIAEVMLDTMVERVADVGRPRGDAEGMTMHEVLTLASIVEREVRRPETMKNVADIFLKRLDIGMALQADSTVNYITGGDDPSISLDDRDNTDSPYNTYKYPGLPPGPISAPSQNAINAVLDPIENDYFYFLTTDSGEIYYAATHDEHVANKAQYLK